MKKRDKKGAQKKRASTVAVDFTRGFVATGLLSLFQDRGLSKRGSVDARRVLRHALQGGMALAAGSAAADALRRRDYTTLLSAVAGGAAGILTIEQLLRRPALTNSREIEHEQEEA